MRTSKKIQYGRNGAVTNIVVSSNRTTNGNGSLVGKSPVDHVTNTTVIKGKNKRKSDEASQDYTLVESGNEVQTSEADLKAETKEKIDEERQLQGIIKSMLETV